MPKPKFRTPVGECNVVNTTAWTLIDGNQYSVKPAHCQREYCWRPEQYQAFIQHAVDTQNYGEVIVIIENHRELYIVDGQHRIKAINDFQNDVFPINDVDTGEEWYYSDICRIDVGFSMDFRLIKVSIREIHLPEYDPVLAQKIYDGYNFGGVRH
jgi:hypothetical protein